MGCQTAAAQASKPNLLVSLIASVALGACQSAPPAPELDAADATPPKRMVTQGSAKKIVDNLYHCPVKVKNHRISPVGQITASDGTVITVGCIRFEPDVVNVIPRSAVFSVDMRNHEAKTLATLEQRVHSYEDVRDLIRTRWPDCPLLPELDRQLERARATLLQPR